MIVYKTAYSDDPFYPVYAHPDWLRPEDRPLRPFPLMLDIETTNACDSRCTFCARKLMTRAPSFMPFDIFRRIVDEGVAEGAPFLRVHGWGEPLLHPEVVRQVAYAAGKGVTMRLTTNGRRIAREPGLVEDLIRAGLRELLVSMQGLEQQSYEEMRKPNTFDNFLRTVETCATAKERLGAPGFFLSIITSVFADEQDSARLDRFRDRFLPFVDKLGVDFTHMTFLENHENVARWAGKYAFNKVRRPCVEVLIKTHVNSAGSILVCGNDYDGDAHRLGNVADTPIRAVWQSEALRAWRERVRDTAAQERMTFCRHCFDFTTKYDQLKAAQGTEVA